MVCYNYQDVYERFVLIADIQCCINAFFVIIAEV